MSKKVLMAILAHPDDETFGMGGTLALYARQGVETILVCATRGEAGEAEEKYLRGYSSMGEMREAELRGAAEKLGLKKLIFLNYRDSGMPGAVDNQHPQALINAPDDELAATFAALMREHGAQVVVTHDPIGGYGHPDHIKIHRAVKKAFALAREQAGGPQKLYFNTISRTILRWVVRLMPLFGRDPRRYGQNQDIDLTRLAAEQTPVHARINFSAVAEERKAASDCYASQGGRKANEGMAGLLRGWARSHEVFMRAFPAPQPGVVEEDLFAGVA
ncbi:MAG TPA: PIG-L family deacetylase [Anaerolineaceae bacterium]|nr:PIG-L family deacetylase [Anaerolineaceae bacterium]HPN54137.1 PIG-L family deacetylase [Anaerolineaceae bacterium]